MKIRVAGVYPPEFEREVGQGAEKNIVANYDELRQKLGTVPMLKNYFKRGFGKEMELVAVDFVPEEGKTIIEVHAFDLPEHEHVRRTLLNAIADTTYIAFGGDTMVRVLDGATKQVLIERKCLEHT